MQIWTDGPCLVPESLSALSSLTRLEFFYSRSTAEVQLDWLTLLTSLRCVYASLDVQAAEFPETLSTMTKLTGLYVVNNTARGYLNFSLNWTGLIRLQGLRIGAQLRVNQSFQRIAALGTLKQVTLKLQDSVADTQYQVAMLAYRLSTARPDVRFVLQLK